MFNSNSAQDELKQINYSRGWTAENKPESFRLRWVLWGRDSNRVKVSFLQFLKLQSACRDHLFVVICGSNLIFFITGKRKYAQRRSIVYSLTNNNASLRTKNFFISILTRRQIFLSEELKCQFILRRIDIQRHFVGMHTWKGSCKRTTGDSLKFTLLSGKNLRTLRQLSVVYIGSR